MTERLAAFAAAICAQAGVRSAAIDHALRTVPRHHCIAAWYGPSGRVEIPSEHAVPDEVLDAVYSDQALVTHLPRDMEGTGSSSSSQPSLMAQMLDSLDLAPGMRVLEIGAGTGYNAALITTITGAEVVTVDVNPAVVTGARKALDRLGLARVSVVEADGYLGLEERAPYARVIVTVACTGFSPHWLAQLEPGGLVLAPIAHGGFHPVTTSGSRSRGRARHPASFMAAAGPLFHRFTQSHAPVAQKLEVPSVTTYPLPSTLEGSAYCDLWFHLAVRDPRVCAAYTEVVDPGEGICAVVGGDEDVVFVQRSRLHHAGSPALLDEVQRGLEAWEDLGRPRVGDWSCRLTLVGPTETPLLAPTGWTLGEIGPATLQG